MSYHNLHLLHYHRRRPSSINSGDNLESNSDPIGKHLIIPSSSSTPTTIVINIQKTRTPPPSKLYFRKLPKPMEDTKTKNHNNNNLLVDYCTYHDVAVSRVTCL